MGFPPPPDAPGLFDQASASASASFPKSPTGTELCGFALPSFTFNVNFRLPGLPKFDFPPALHFPLALKCDLSNPFDVPSGGGRVSQPPDDALERDD